MCLFWGGSNSQTRTHTLTHPHTRTQEHTLKTFTLYTKNKRLNLLKFNYLYINK